MKIDGEILTDSFFSVGCVLIRWVARIVVGLLEVYPSPFWHLEQCDSDALRWLCMEVNHSLPYESILYLVRASKSSKIC